MSLLADLHSIAKLEPPNLSSFPLACGEDTYNCEFTLSFLLTIPSFWGSVSVVPTRAFS